MTRAALALLAVALSGCDHRDDAAYLQRTINQQALTGHVKLPEGVYRLKHTLEFPSSLKDIDGGSARLIWAGGRTKCVLHFGQLQDATIHDLNVDSSRGGYGALYCIDSKERK
jgi:hypothetical protein